MSVLSQIFNMTKICQDFAKFKPSQVQSGQKCKFWSEFKTELKIFGFCQISSIAGWVVKNVYFEPNFQPDS